MGCPLTMMISLLLCVLAGPATVPSRTMTGESLVLAGTTPANLLAPNVDPATVVVRSTSAPGGTTYAAGKDYVVDGHAGTIARTPDSRIPDFAKNVLYAKQNFDHSQFPGYGNLPFTVYVDYGSADLPRLAEPTAQTSRLAKTRARLEAGGPFKLIAFGDSIAAGGEASSESLRFQNRYADHLSERFPKAKITVENGATGGDNTVNGLARLEEKVLSRKPDLVLIGFGMNDHNRAGVGGVEPAQFQANLEAIVKSVRARTGADVILFSAFPPHPQWAFGTHRMHEYAAATQAAAESTGVAYADVYAAWMKVLERKDASSLLANNINHPNDYGHWLYAEALRAVGF
jgi:acyl-CoA thioesterase-1